PRLRALRVASPPPSPGAHPAARQSRFRGCSGITFSCTEDWLSPRARALRVVARPLARGGGHMTFSLQGLPVARGIVIGRAVLVVSSRIDVAHYFIKPDEVEAEIDRVRVARNA